jgi:peptide subunit release factor 1 (eRF1)
MTTVRYTYISKCCGHEYIEQREEKEPAYFSTCHSCGQGEYELKTSEISDPAS